MRILYQICAIVILPYQLCAVCKTILYYRNIHCHHTQSLTNYVYTRVSEHLFAWSTPEEGVLCCCSSREEDGGLIFHPDGRCGRCWSTRRAEILLLVHPLGGSCSCSSKQGEESLLLCQSWGSDSCIPGVPWPWGVTLRRRIRQIGVWGHPGGAPGFI